MTPTDEILQRLRKIEDSQLAQSVRLNHCLERIETALTDILAYVKREEEEVVALEDRLDSIQK